MTKNILFICRSFNQTAMMHKIAQNLGDYNCYFTPYYADGIEDPSAHLGLLNFTVLGGRHKQETTAYLANNRWPADYRGKSRNYDLVVTCSDLIIQKIFAANDWRWFRKASQNQKAWSTNWSGASISPVIWQIQPQTSNAYDIFCVASQGYREHFIKKGVRPEKIAVSGIPDFDDLSKFYENNFSLHDYVLVATSPLRESRRRDDRMAFLQRCVQIAKITRRLLHGPIPVLEQSRRGYRSRSKWEQADLF